MAKQVEFFFDVGSPASYLASTQLPALCAATHAELVLRPMLLGGVFKSVGNQSPAMVLPKGVYMTTDLARFAKRYGVRFAMNPFFPINTMTLMRVAVGVQLNQPERLVQYLDVAWKSLWADGLNFNDLAVVGKTFAAAGFDPAQLLAYASDDTVKTTLRATTDEAVSRGVFGAPTMFVGKDMFFGQDRLDFVREALA